MTRRETQIHAHLITEALDGHAHLRGSGYMGRSSVAFSVLEALRVKGYTVLKLSTVKKHQHDRDILKHQIAWLEREAKMHEQSREKDYAEERRLRDRLTYVYGVAQAHGATEADLKGPETLPCAWMIDDQQCTKENEHNRRPGDYGHTTPDGTLWASKHSGVSTP